MKARDAPAPPSYAGLEARGSLAVVDADVSTITAEVDKVIRVEGPEPWLVHFEFQTAREAALPRRLQRYNILLDYRHDLPVQSVAILLRPEADSADLDGTHRRWLPDGRTCHEFQYLVVRPWQKPVEEVLRGGLGTLPPSLLADGAHQDMPRVIHRMEERLEAEATKEQEGVLWTAALILAGGIYTKDDLRRWFRGAQSMRDSAGYQLILEEGEAKGAKAVLPRIAQKRLGPPSPEARAAIDAITDRERVELLAERAVDAGSWEDLLATP